MAPKHGHVDKGSIRNIMVVMMKSSSKSAVLVDLKAANLYQGMSTTGMLSLLVVIAPMYLQHVRKRISPKQ